MRAEIDMTEAMQKMTFTVSFPPATGLRLRIAAWLIGLAGKVAPVGIETVEPWSEDDALSWQRCIEATDAGGTIVLVRHPEGYRLRYHGETVWSE